MTDMINYLLSDVLFVQFVRGNGLETKAGQQR